MWVGGGGAARSSFSLLFSCGGNPRNQRQRARRAVLKVLKVPPLYFLGFSTLPPFYTAPAHSALLKIRERERERERERD